MSGAWARLATAARLLTASPSRAAAVLVAVEAATGLPDVLGLLPWDQGTGAIILAIVALVVGLFAYLAYRMWFRPSRVIVAILLAILLITWTSILTSSAPWEWWPVVIGIIEAILLVMAWNEPRVVGRAAPDHAGTE